MPKPKPFARLLRELREKAGMSVAELATRADMTREAVRLYELGRRQPTWDAVQRLAAALATSTDSLRDQ